MGNASSSVTTLQAVADFGTYCSKEAVSAYSDALIYCTAMNKLTLKLGAAQSCGSDASAYRCYPDDRSCPISVTQTAKSICSLDVETAVNLDDAVNQNMSALLDAFVSAPTPAVNKWIDAAFRVNTVGITSSADLVTKITNAATVNSTATCDAQSLALNDEQILLCGTQSGPININQDASAQVIASCFNSAVLNTFARDPDLKQLASETDAELKKNGQDVPDVPDGPNVPDESGIEWWVWLLIFGGAALLVVGAVLVVVAVTKNKNRVLPEHGAVPSVRWESTAPTTTAPIATAPITTVSVPTVSVPALFVAR